VALTTCLGKQDAQTEHIHKPSPGRKNCRRGKDSQPLSAEIGLEIVPHLSFYVSEPHRIRVVAAGLQESCVEIQVLHRETKPHYLPAKPIPV
jgi:NAD(P)H-nitrite reductase large subunit